MRGRNQQKKAVNGSSRDELWFRELSVGAR